MKSRSWATWRGTIEDHVQPIRPSAQVQELEYDAVFLLRLDRELPTVTIIQDQNAEEKQPTHQSPYIASHQGKCRTGGGGVRITHVLLGSLKFTHVHFIIYFSIC